MHEDSSTPKLRVPRATLTCQSCKKPFEVLPSQALRTGRPYCSPDCASEGKKTAMEARFWAGVRKTDTCWLWEKAVSHGRPVLPLPGHNAGYIRADVFSWELHFAPLAPGEKFHQACGNYTCVNPDHLTAGPKPRKERAKKVSANPRPPKVECICALAACGKTFLVWPSRFANGKEVKYCSPKCRTTALSRPLADRFWEKVDKNGPTPPDHPEMTNCYLWKGATAGKYGAFEGTTAHRVALLLDGRPAPEDGDACHHCDVPLCVRFDHLFPGSKPDNIHDMITKGRRGRVGPQGSGQLNPVAVRVIRFMWDNRQATQVALARAHRVHATTVQRVVRRQIWPEVEEQVVTH